MDCKFRVQSADCKQNELRFHCVYKHFRNAQLVLMKNMHIICLSARLKQLGAWKLSLWIATGEQSCNETELNLGLHTCQKSLVGYSFWSCDGVCQWWPRAFSEQPWDSLLQLESIVLAQEWSLQSGDTPSHLRGSGAWLLTDASWSLLSLSGVSIQTQSPTRWRKALATFIIIIRHALAPLITSTHQN